MVAAEGPAITGSEEEGASYKLTGPLPSGASVHDFQSHLWIGLGRGGEGLFWSCQCRLGSSHHQKGLFSMKCLRKSVGQGKL